MGVCVDLLKGWDLECDGAQYRKYFQQLVLVNRADVDEYLIDSTSTTNNIAFNLKDGKTGFLFRSSENGTVINAEFSKSVRKGIVYYDHKMELAITGVDEDSKTMLKQLDMSDYFGAIQFKDGTVEIHGFSYGLKTDSYNYTPQGLGGSIISLVSKYPEYDPPYVYLSDDPIEDFNCLFSCSTCIFGGDFNDDFNDDFLIGTCEGS